MLNDTGPRLRPTPQQLGPTVGRANPVRGDDPEGVSHADRLWIALTLARAGDTPSTRAHTKDAVFRFYLPMARSLARASAQYPDDPQGAEQAAELGLTAAVLAWRYPSGQGSTGPPPPRSTTTYGRAAPEPPRIPPERPPRPAVAERRPPPSTNDQT